MPGPGRRRARTRRHASRLSRGGGLELPGVTGVVCIAYLLADCWVFSIESMRSRGTSKGAFASRSRHRRQVRAPASAQVQSGLCIRSKRALGAGLRVLGRAALAGRRASMRARQRGLGGILVAIRHRERAAARRRRIRRGRTGVLGVAIALLLGGASAAIALGDSDDFSAGRPTATQSVSRSQAPTGSARLSGASAPKAPAVNVYAHTLAGMLAPVARRARYLV